MIQECAVSKEPGIQGVCGLLGKDDVTGSEPDGFIQALREMVEHFQITWGVTPLHESDSGESIEIGFALDLNGTHESAADHAGRTCRQCANLMLALKIIGDWLFPRQGKCSFCEVQAYHNFIRGDEQVQAQACSTRTLRLVSHLGTRCQLAACHVWCMTKMTERLNRIGAVERGRNRLSGERAGSGT
jgi:hypothetical protein